MRINIPAPPVKFIIRLSAHRGGVSSRQTEVVDGEKVGPGNKAIVGGRSSRDGANPVDWLVVGQVTSLS